MKFQHCCVSVSACSMRSLRKTVLLALVASVVLVLAVLHSWPTRIYSTVDVRYRPGPGAERLLEERLPELDPSTSTIPYRVRESVARSVSLHKLMLHVFLLNISSSRGRLEMVVKSLQLLTTTYLKFSCNFYFSKFGIGKIL